MALVRFRVDSGFVCWRLSTVCLHRGVSTERSTANQLCRPQLYRQRSNDKRRDTQSECHGEHECVPTGNQNNHASRSLDTAVPATASRKVAS